jgi:hypothetical protein
MSRMTNRATGSLAAVVVAATLAAGASPASDGPRSQDALDAARSLPPQQLVAVSEGLRSRQLHSQDALDAARSLPPDQLVAVSEGLRSRGAPEATAPGVSESDGFDWPLAVIGISVAVLLGARQVRRRPPKDDVPEPESRRVLSRV